MCVRECVCVLRMRKVIVRMSVLCCVVTCVVLGVGTPRLKEWRNQDQPLKRPVPLVNGVAVSSSMAALPISAWRLRHHNVAA